MESINEPHSPIRKNQSKSFTFQGLNDKETYNNESSKEDDSFKNSCSLNDNDDNLGYKSTYNQICDQKEEKESTSNETEKTAEIEKPKVPYHFMHFDSPIKNCIPYIINSPNNNQNRSEFRKMSSPICSYYHSSYKVLSEMLEKNSSSIIDYSKSNNFIKKDSLFINSNNSNCTGINNNNTENNNTNIFPYYDNNNYLNDRKPYSNCNDGNEEDKINRMRTSSFSGLNDYSNLTLGKFNPFILRGPKVNPISLFFPNKINMNNSYCKSNGKHKTLTEREGDWICSKCKNLNFAFRIICNRCKLVKSESEKMAESVKKNIKGNLNNSSGNGNGVQKKNYHNSPGNLNSNENEKGSLIGKGKTKQSEFQDKEEKEQGEIEN